MVLSYGYFYHICDQIADSVMDTEHIFCYNKTLIERGVL